MILLCVNVNNVSKSNDDENKCISITRLNLFNSDIQINTMSCENDSNLLIIKSKLLIPERIVQQYFKNNHFIVDEKALNGNYDIMILLDYSNFHIDTIRINYLEDYILYKNKKYLLTQTFFKIFSMLIPKFVYDDYIIRSHYFQTE
jgi:hypothetical protein